MEDKERVRQKVDMVQLVGEVVDLKRSGVNWKGLCPFHEERSPSFMVNPELQIYKCFGCGESGDCFSWIMKREGVEFGEALRILAEKVGVELQYKQTGQDLQKKRLLEVMEEALKFYEFLLLKHEAGEAGRSYLLDRGIEKELWEVFRLGWAPDSWDGLLRTMKRRGFSEKELLEAGLVSKSEKGRVYDRFRGRVIFGLRDVRGRVVGVAGRIIVKDDEAPKYINSPETPIYHKGELLYGLEITKDAVRKAKRMVIVEGELDTISSWQSGLQEVVALKGTALTEAQIQLIKRYADEIVLALDMDQAGDKAALRGIRMAEKAGLEVRLVRLPEGKDPDDLARENPKKWRSLVDKALEIYDYWLQSTLQRYDVSTAQGKRMIIEELAPIWKGIENPILHGHWIGELARRLGVDERRVEEYLKREPQSKDRPPTITKKKTIVPRKRYLEEVLVGLLWVEDKSRLKDADVGDLLDLDWSKKLVALVGESKDEISLPDEIKERLGVATMYPEVSLGQSIIPEVLLELRLLQLRGLKKQVAEEVRATSSHEELPTALLEKQGEVLSAIRQVEQELKELRATEGGLLSKLRI